jgi:hypothetical protein
MFTAKNQLNGKRWLRAGALTLLALALAFVWPNGGVCQGPCTIERGQDPLDVLTQTIRHNVFISLDTSGSMSAAMPDVSAQGPEGNSADKKDTNVNDNCGPGPGDCSARLRIAKDVLNELLAEFVDGFGGPVVNWGYVNFNPSQGSQNNTCGAQFGSPPALCNGHLMSSLVPPPTCGGADSRPSIVPRLKLISQGGVPASGNTPNGVSLDQLSSYIQTNLLPKLLPNQKNFIIHLTDGEDTCECPNSIWNNPAGQSGMVRINAANATPVTDVRPAPTAANAPVPASGRMATYRRGYNAGLKAQIAYDRIDPQHDGSKGDIFVVGMGVPPPPYTQGKANVNAPYTTGTATVTSGSTTVNFAGGANIPTSIGNGDEFIINGLSFRVNTRVSSTQITLQTPAPGFSLANQPYQLRETTVTFNGGANIPTSVGSGDTLNLGGRVYYINTRPNSTTLTLTTGAVSGFNNASYSIEEQSYFVENTHHLAWEASGVAFGRPGRSAFIATNKAALKQALKDALSAIGIPPTIVSLGAPVVGSVKELIPLNNPNVTPSMVHGDVNNLSDFGAAQKVTLQHQNNVLFTTLVEAPSFKGRLKARLVYQVVQQNVNGQIVDVKVPSFQDVWDAGDELQKRDPDDRTILFNRKGETLLRPFRVGQVTPADVGFAAGAGVGFLSSVDGTGALTDADATEIVVQVIRGYRLSKDPVTNKIYRPDGKLNFSPFESDGVTKTWKLYDSTSPGAAVIGRPQRPPSVDAPQHHTTEYKTFYETNFNRQTIVYLGSNGGMMHAFRADNGAELWAYIPDDVMGIQSPEIAGTHSTLKDLVNLVVNQNNGVQNHHFFMSGAANAEDVVLSTDDKWHTLVAFGRGKGGKFFSALDVSNAGDWDQAYGNLGRIPEADPRLPKLLFNVGNRDGVADGPGGVYDGLGETWSTPVMGEVKLLVSGNVKPQAVLFAGSGYGCKNTLEGRYFYVLRLEDGSVLRRLGPISSTPGAPILDNALVASPAVFNPHTFDRSKLDPRDYSTRSYIGDLQGNVYKLDSSSTDPANWTFKVIASLGLNQPIGAPVAFLSDPNVPDTIYFFVGSGGDSRVQAAGGTFKLAGFLDDDPDGSNTPAPIINGGGFLIDLGAEHRVFIAPVTAHTADGNGTVFFASTRPEFVAATCTNTFSSTLYAFQARTGLAAFDMDPNQGGTQTSVNLPSGSKITGLYHRDGHLYVSKSGGFGVASETEVRGSGQFGSQGGTGPLVNVLVNSFRVSPF